MGQNPQDWSIETTTQAVTERLQATRAMTDRAITYWLQARIRWLGDRTPLEVLALETEEDFERVCAAGDLFVDPNAQVRWELLTTES